MLPERDTKIEYTTETASLRSQRQRKEFRGFGGFSPKVMWKHPFYFFLPFGGSGGFHALKERPLRMRTYHFAEVPLGERRLAFGLKVGFAEA